MAKTKKNYKNYKKQTKTKILAIQMAVLEWFW